MSNTDSLLTDHIAKIRQRFLADLESNSRPRIESLLEATEDIERPTLFRVLLTAEREHGARCGRALDRSDHLRRFPEYSGIIHEVWSSDVDSDSGVNSATADYTGNVVPAFRLSPAVQVDSMTRTKGRYRLDYVVGRGGFGEVWKAYDPQLERVVAVKIPRQDRTFTSDQLNGFLVEARRVARLKIAGVVSVHDVGLDGSAHFIVSDFVDGETLADRIKRERLPWTESARIVADVSETLHRAHLLDIVHRDVKPSNILVDKSGHLYVTDFGLAINEAEQLQEPELVLGTFAYMPPEQARGTSNCVDARADVYSLGVILYQLLTNRLPFTGTSANDYRNQILQREARPPRTIDDTIPIELERICLKCLAKSPAGRYSTAKDLAHDLRKWIAEGSEAIPKAATNHLWYTLAAAFVVIALVLTVISFRPFVGSRGQDNRALPIAASPAVTPQSAEAINLTEQPAKADDSSSTISVERVWTAQLGQLPRELIWPGYRAGGVLGFRADLQAYEVISDPERLVQLGVLDGRSCRLGINIEQPVWGGSVGIFLGYHEVDTDEGRGARMQLIQGSRHHPPEGTPVYRITRRVVQILPRNGVPTTVRELGYADVRWPEDSRTVRLEIELRDNQLIGATWNSEPLRIGSESQNRRINEADYIGPWGVYSHRATSWFRHPSLQFSQDSK